LRFTRMRALLRGVGARVPAFAMTRVAAATFLFCNVGCFAHNAWRHVYHEPSCGSFETVVVKGDYHPVSVISGVVEFFDHQERAFPLEDVEIIVRRLGSSEVLATVHTNPSGAFSFPTLPDGWYQIAGCKLGFAARIVPVRVATGGPNRPIRLFLRLAE
jgi:hypothetical protein